MSLSDLACKNSTPQKKPYKLPDSEGLYLYVSPAGGRTWRLKYRFLGKEKLLTIGKYPSVKLAEARKERDVAKEKIANNIDPASEKQAEKKAIKYDIEQTVKIVFTEWYEHNLSSWSKSYAKEVIGQFNRHLFPTLGDLPIRSLTLEQTYNCLLEVEKKGLHESARRLFKLVGHALRYGVRTGRANKDFTSDIKGGLKRFKRGHFAAIKADGLPALMEAINKNEARLYRRTILAIKLIMLTFVRTNELINAKWSEFDLEKRLWVVPAERMKMRIAHKVPLSNQVIEILLELKKDVGNSEYILPSLMRENKSISDGTILKALEKLGFKKKMTGHGFRALAMSTIKQNLHYRHEVVDRQLAHSHKDEVEAAYDRADFYDERVEMMQKWADYIDDISANKA